mmetsp:Transcript_111174/g.254946  ORF Transcript_111174/g.254946 Transcript_111174/m.254946 type:complete len:225 (+) Transcript_111174:1034-1708(+)
MSLPCSSPRFCGTLLSRMSVARCKFVTCLAAYLSQCPSSNPPQELELRRFTLFQIMTLDDWAGGIARPMMDISLATVFVFLIYIAFTTFSLLNIVTGVFVDSTSHASKRDEEEMMRCQMAERDSFMADLRSFFETADTDGNGFITYDEFETVLSSSEDVRSHLEQLNIGTREARGLFRILDLDGGGAVSIDEFIFGCLRMKGAAKSTVSRSGSWHHAAGQAWML